jgi:hypothetical protein
VGYGGSLSLDIRSPKPEELPPQAQKGVPPQAPPKEGMCLAEYRMLGVGDIKEKRIKPQRLRFNSQYCRV